MKFLKKNLFELIIFAAFLLFSWWLMWHTFNYKDGIIYIASKAWSDFAAHLPLIRSFSWGKNFPPEYPLFPGEPIRYHFLFYLLVGLLEKIGLPLDWALNIPSVFGFWTLLIIIYFLTRFLFNKKIVAFLTVLFFLFNSSLSFIYFFQKHNPFSIKIFSDIISNQKFPAFAPYDQSLISGGFWNLNVFTNQRHFALSLAILLTLVLWVIKKIKRQHFNFKTAAFCGSAIGFLPLLHTGVFIMSLAVFGGIFLLFNQKKKVAILLITTFIFSLPQIFYLKSGATSTGLVFKPGYLVSQNFTFFTFFRYWLLNLGLGFFLIAIGFFLSDSFSKKIFLIFLPIFFLGNLFQFGPDMAVNHKFFNLWIIIGNMFIAYALFRLWRKRILGKVLAILITLFLTLSGVIDFFAIENDALYPVSDAALNPDISWIKNNTAKDAVFLNTAYLYHPANLAGRKIFLGWPYFSWSLGYNTHQRDAERKKMLVSSDKNSTCNFLTANKIDFISLDDKEKNLFLNKKFWQANFPLIYENKKSGFSIYDARQVCQ